MGMMMNDHDAIEEGISMLLEILDTLMEEELQDLILSTVHQKKWFRPLTGGSSETERLITMFKNANIIRNKDVQEIRKVGSGSFGIVYQGIWRGQYVAIKRMKTRGFNENSSEPERQRYTFLQEVAVLSELHHPNVVEYHGVILDGPGGTLATVTSYVEHGSLRDILFEKSMKISGLAKLLIAVDVASGMEHLHSKNIVHFDLKSSNLFVNLTDPAAPECVIGDLGLSEIKKNAMVCTGARGTIPWMAPELLKKDALMVTEKVDVYSFGIVMWEILTGEEPYAGMACKAIIEGVVNNTLRPPVPIYCKPHWRELMESCWTANHQQRPSFQQISTSLLHHSYFENDFEDNFMDKRRSKDIDQILKSSKERGKIIRNFKVRNKKDNIHWRPGKFVSTLYGIRPTIIGDERQCDKQDDLHQKHGESGIYGVGPSVVADEHGRTKQDQLSKQTMESVSDMYEIRVGSMVDRTRHATQDDLQEATDASAFDIYKIEASTYGTGAICNEEVGGYKEQSICDIYGIGTSIITTDEQEHKKQADGHSTRASRATVAKNGCGVQDDFPKKTKVSAFDIYKIEASTCGASVDIRNESVDECTRQSVLDIYGTGSGSFPGEEGGHKKQLAGLCGKTLETTLEMDEQERLKHDDLVWFTYESSFNV